MKLKHLEYTCCGPEKMHAHVFYCIPILTYYDRIDEGKIKHTIWVWKSACTKVLVSKIFFGRTAKLSV
jgi:hypothetical protein